MILYEITVGNFMDDTNYSVLVLSNEPLCKNNINIEAIAEIDKDFEYIESVKNPKVKINAWDENDFNELEIVRKQL